MNKRTLILRSNPIAPDSRVEKEAAALQEKGWDVTILAWDRRRNHKIVQEVKSIFGYKIPIILFGHEAKYGNGIKSLNAFLKFQINIFRWLFANKKEYDIIHACDFDTAFTSSIANLFLKKKFVFDIFDYIGGDRKTILQKILCRLQTWIINRSDVTILCTEERKKQIGKAKPKQTVIIHNAPPRIKMISDSLLAPINAKIKVCYVGILQDYRLLMEIPKFFINHSEYELHIGGFGKYEEFYKELSLKHDNIIYYGSLPYEETLKLENECDIMLAIYDPTIENHVFAAPNKFYEGLMIGKPLIMVNGTGMSYIVKKYNIGETIDYSYQGFEDGIFRITERRNEWPEITKKMKEIYNMFSWDEMKIRLDTLYRDLM